VDFCSITETLVCYWNGRGGCESARGIDEEQMIADDMLRMLRASFN
jgi:hypothetical protein